MEKHQKHTKLSKPEMGNFGRNEIALVGAPCDIIQDLVTEISPNLSFTNLTYIDADHAFGDQKSDGIKFNEFTDKIKYQRLDKSTFNDFDKKILLNDQDLILVNGNHFQATQQIVFIHSKKEDSLKKRLTQLTDIKAFVLCEGMDMPFGWLLDSIQGAFEIPVFSLHDNLEIAHFINSLNITPQVKGLVLAGGKSTRMGTDKGQINYHGMPQVDYLLSQFEKANIEAFVSCRPDQYENYNRISDKFEGLGPFGAIASAFQTDPNAAWLVIACDLPLVNADVFKELLNHRKPDKLATAFYNSETGFPDPLITLWEPKAYMRLLEFLALGFSCPRKVLINSDINLIKSINSTILLNVNTPEERTKFKEEKTHY